MWKSAETYHSFPKLAETPSWNFHEYELVLLEYFVKVVLKRFVSIVLFSAVNYFRMRFPCKCLINVFDVIETPNCSEEFILDWNETYISFWSPVPIVFWYVFPSACDVFPRGASRPGSTMVESKNSSTCSYLIPVIFDREKLNISF